MSRRLDFSLPSLKVLIQIIYILILYLRDGTTSYKDLISRIRPTLQHLHFQSFPIANFPSVALPSVTLPSVALPSVAHIDGQ